MKFHPTDNDGKFCPHIFSDYFKARFVNNVHTRCGDALHVIKNTNRSCKSLIILPISKYPDRDA